MNYESIKSILLSILVLLSFLLTWNIWTYQPKYEEMENPEYIKEVSIGSSKADISSIVKPVQIFYHKNNYHYGTTNSQELNSVVKEVKKWQILELKNISSSFKKLEFQNFSRQNGFIEIVYPDEITIDVLKKIYQIDDKDLHSITFDKIILDHQDVAKDSAKVYFVSSKFRKVYFAKSDEFSFGEIEKKYQNAANLYSRYFPYEVSESRTIFLPEEKIQLNKYQYYVHFLDADKFKDALFSDPSIVKKEILPTQLEYTDGSRLMEVDLTNHILSYVNPQGNEENESELNDLLEQSVDFINDHGGWTDTYQFFSLDKYNEQTTFRLYLNGVPTFNQYGMAEIIQYWKSNDIYSYNRPMIKLQLSDRDNEPQELPSGHSAIEKIEEIPNYNPEFLDAVVVGYELIQDYSKENMLRDRTIIFEPAWYYCYSGAWRKVNFEPPPNTPEGGS